MKINPVNFYSVCKNQNFGKVIPFFGNFNSSKLAPLSADTISFEGKTENKKANQSNETSSSKKEVNHSYRPSLNNAQKIYDESEYAYGQLKYILSQTFGMHVIDSDSADFKKRADIALDSNRAKPVVMITARRKSPASIAEKMSTQKIRSTACAKRDLNDLIGARIIVSGTSTEEGNYVLDKLTDAVKKGRIKIEKVKNHGQPDSKLRYATKAKLDKIVTTSRKSGVPLCQYIDQPRDTGYLAIHLITDEIADGYNAEIQIMGLDVERFKEIEDLCYKCRAGKKVPKKYEAIENLFKSYKNDKKMWEDYSEYTKRAYAYERLKANHKKDENLEFLSIPKDLNIPKELDFNNIAFIKKKADRQQEI